jgi:hypothetical protein
MTTGCSKNTPDPGSELDQLKSLPYVSWSDTNADDSLYGVTIYHKDKAFPGYNLYFNLKDRAYLMDMEGKIVHTWFMPYHTGVWEYGYLKPNGNLIAYSIDLAATELDWNSNPIWYTKMRAHHDVEMLPDGSCLIPNTFRKQYKSRTVLFNSITRLSPEGQILDEWSSWDAKDEIGKYHRPGELDEEPGNPGAIKNDEFDYYHLNSIKLLPPNDLEKKDSRFREGNWLICMRNISLILILDKDTKEIVWGWGPDDLDWPHMPVMLPSGEILIFDNGLSVRKYSRVVQVNPVTNKITWEFKTDPPEKFFSGHWGAVQRFSNGNTLITNSASGHVFELSKKQNIVWEFYNYDVQVDKRKRIYRLIRYPQKMVDTLLKKLTTTDRGPGSLKNKGFEEKDNVQDKIPAAWKYTAWIFDTARFTWDSTIARTGTWSAKLQLLEPNVGHWGQLLTVEPDSTYRLRGWAKTIDVPEKNADGYVTGVTIAGKVGNEWPVHSSFLSGTNDWTELSCEFKTGNNTELEIQCKMGSAGAEITGEAWFDDIELVKVK